MEEKWKIGKQQSVVVSDTKVKNTNFPIPPNPEESKDEDLEYYGGYLICESIGNDQHAKKIAAVPELINAVQSLITSYVHHCPEADKDSNAIKNARELLKKLNENINN